ncbi:MAG: type II and III secretion system protein [Candidatus Hydrogenedentes bacterium]|nr:type II and III secretion system protein [Candidatus Hydrogenedentota bacterium]
MMKHAVLGCFLAVFLAAGLATAQDPAPAPEAAPAPAPEAAPAPAPEAAPAPAPEAAPAPAPEAAPASAPEAAPAPAPEPAPAPAPEAAPAPAPEPAPAPAPEPAPAPAPEPAPAPAPEAAPAPAPEAAPAPAPEAAPAPAEAAPPPPPPPPPKDIRQVQVQVWISQTDEDGAREVGSNLNYTRFVRGVEQSGSLERLRTETFTPNDDTFSSTLPAPDGSPYPDNVRLTPESNTPWTNGNALINDPDRSGEYQLNTQRGAGLTYSIIDNDRGTIEGILRAVETKSDSDLISKPELLVINGQTAIIKAGDEIPYQGVEYKTGVPILKISWRELGVNINMQPVILPNELVQINITNLEVSDRLKDTPIQGLQVPVFSTRKQTGSVLVPNTQTLVIGGLSSRVVRKTEKRVPIIGRLPVLGLPFRGRENDIINSHLLIFVSPTVVDLREMKPPMQDALDFWRGVEWRNREQLAQEADLMDEDL